MTTAIDISKSPRILVYNFDTTPRKGFGARLHDILNCLVYCRANNVEFGLVCDQDFNHYGYKWSEIFQWESKYRIIDKNDLKSSDFIKQWPEMSWGSFGKNHPQYRKFFSIAFYAKMAQELFQLQPEVQAKIDELITNSGFLASDWVIHVRWSDKVKQVANKATVIESGPQDLWWYWKPIADKWKSSVNMNSNHKIELSSRVFICSDSFEPLELLPTPVPFPIVWDHHEDRSGNYCPKTFRNDLSEADRTYGIIYGIENLQIMQNCNWLCGAQCSYFFRIGELLDFPSRSENVKDNDMFGMAEYESRPNIKQIRPRKD